MSARGEPSRLRHILERMVETRKYEYPTPYDDLRTGLEIALDIRTYREDLDDEQCGLLAAYMADVSELLSRVFVPPPDPYALRVFATPTDSPASRFAAVADLLSPKTVDGETMPSLITPEQALQLLDTPDLGTISEDALGNRELKADELLRKYDFSDIGESLAERQRVSEAAMRYQGEVVNQAARSLQQLGDQRYQRLPRLPSVAELARVLWREDPNVTQFVNSVADAVCGRSFDLQRHKVAADRAWDRDEGGWRSLWTERAEAVLARLAGGGK